MKSLKSHKYKPSKELQNSIDAYWEVYNPTDESFDVPIVPDGCIDIVIIDAEVFIVGLMEVAFIKTIKPKSHYFGIRFKPGVAFLVLDCDVSIFNDKMMLLEEFDGELHSNIITIFEDRDNRVSRFDLLFSTLIVQNASEDNMQYIINGIIGSGGNSSIEMLCIEASISQKQAERLFVKRVGLTPKKFARVIRFFHTHKHLSKEGMDDLCIKVLDKGYYDQAHFNREYKAFTGYHPSSDTMSILYNTKE